MLPGCTGNCDQGRGRCDCIPVPAEACTELGADEMMKPPTVRQQITDLVLAVLLVLIIVLLSLSWELIK